MYLNTKFVFDHGDGDYRVIVGESIDEDRLNGMGKDITVNGGTTTVVIGTFKEGRLNGIGAKIVNGVCVESGLYQDGKLIDAEAFKKNAKKTIVPETEKYGRKYVDSVLYYHEGEEGNVSGYTLLVCDTMVVHFIGGNQRVKGERSCLRYAEFKGNEPIGLMAFENYAKGEGASHDYLFDKYDDRLLAFWNVDVEKRLFMWKAIRVEEGTKSLPKGFLNAGESIVLYLPRSIEKLEDGAVSGKKPYYMEVFYEGTKEEWEKIEKGRYETYEYEDFYGYYYHNSERYCVSRRYFDWVRNAPLVVIHCLDGDTLTHDRSYN